MRRLRGASIVLSVMLVLEMLVAASALPDLRSLETRRDPSDTFNVNITQEQEYVLVEEWLERKMAPLQRCNSLLRFEIKVLKAEELPERWVAECPRLVALLVWRAKNLTKLPANLLERASALEYLIFCNSMIESLPDGFLAGATKLRVLYLYENHLTTLTSASLAGPPLETLSLLTNQLTNEAMHALAPLTTLRTLDISNNSLSNLCERNGYSMLKNLTELRELSLGGLNITHLCRDWSEMKYLNQLEFSNTQITELDFADVYLSRDPTVPIVTYTLVDVRIDKLRLTLDDYKLAVRSPPTTLLFMSDRRNRSDCETAIWPRCESFSWITHICCLSLDFVTN